MARKLEDIQRDLYAARQTAEELQQELKQALADLPRSCLRCGYDEAHCCCPSYFTKGSWVPDPCEGCGYKPAGCPCPRYFAVYPPVSKEGA